MILVRDMIRVVILCLTLASCATPGISRVQASEPIALPAQMAYAMVQQGAILVDVRTDQERAVSFEDPRGAYRIPYPKNGMGDKALFVKRVSALREANHNAPVVLICSKGIRSQWAGEALASSGLTEVYTVVGGLEGDRGWVDSDLPVEE